VVDAALTFKFYELTSKISSILLAENSIEMDLPFVLSEEEV
jgi:hypothetical protein